MIIGLGRADSAATPQTVEAYRYDVGGTLQSMQETPEGFLMMEGYFAKPGVMEYVQADGSITRELVLPDELHKADSLTTLGRKPVALEHPQADGVLVAMNPDNFAKFAVGDVGEDVQIVQDTGFVKVSMVVKRRDAIDAVKRGTRELSPGYKVDLEQTPGEHPQFGRYDAIQRNRRYNHLAITEQARGGHQLRLRADSGYQRRDSDPNPNPNPQPTPGTDRTAPITTWSTPMGITNTDHADAVTNDAARIVELNGQAEQVIVRLDAAKVDTAGLRSLFTSFSKDLSSAQKGKRDAEKLAADLQKKVDEFMAKEEEEEEEDAKAKADAAKPEAIAKANADAFKANMEFYEQRKALEARADAAGLKAEDVAKCDNDALRVELVKTHQGDKFDAAKANDPAYIAAAFDMLPEPGQVQPAPHGDGGPDPYAQFSKRFDTALNPTQGDGQQQPQIKDPNKMYADSCRARFNETYGRK